jgi:uncharacterized membrane protein YfcA
VTLVEGVALVGAGVLAGLSGSMAGLASLFSYPALLAAGLTPVAANVSNTVCLGVATVGAALGSRPELVGQGRNVWRYGVVTAAGGAAGAALLLSTPAEVFETVVPFLVAGASTVLLLQPRLEALRGEQGDSVGPVALAGIFAIGLYGGYFGAAAGILMLAVLGCLLSDSLLRVNALKTIVLGLANAIAAVAFVAFGPVAWWAVLPLSVGLVAGNLAGPWLLRRLPASGLRIGVALAGYALAASYLHDALR